MFYIESLEHGPIGNSRVWWRANSRGYTTDLKAAGMYWAADARKIVQGAHGNEIAWPTDVVIAAASKHVSADQPLKSDRVMRWTKPKE